MLVYARPPLCLAHPYPASSIPATRCPIMQLQDLSYSDPLARPAMVLPARRSHNTDHNTSQPHHTAHHLARPAPHGKPFASTPIATTMHTRSPPTSPPLPQAHPHRKPRATLATWRLYLPHCHALIGTPMGSQRPPFLVAAPYRAMLRRRARPGCAGPATQSRARRNTARRGDPCPSPALPTHHHRHHHHHHHHPTPHSPTAHPHAHGLGPSPQFARAPPPQSCPVQTHLPGVLGATPMGTPPIRSGAAHQAGRTHLYVCTHT